MGLNIEKQYLEKLTLEQLMEFFPDNVDIYHDSGVWKILTGRQEHYDNENIKELLINFISKHDFPDSMDIACRKFEAERIKHNEMPEVVKC